uniref:Arginyl-tRNA synthetase n=1 Tax=Arcella intermedia TaxID=1963864 RepID=A0A6B2L437_9EUKA
MEKLLREPLASILKTDTPQMKILVKPSSRNPSYDYECDFATFIYSFKGKAEFQEMLSLPSRIKERITGNDVIGEVSAIRTWLCINLKKEYLSSHAMDPTFLTQSKVIDPVASTTRTLIDYSSPNMAKEFHVGHLRSMMHGAALMNILKFQGYEVSGVSHVGDFGSPMGQVVSEVIHRDLPFVRAIKEGKKVSEDMYPTPTELSAIYVAAKQRAKDDKDFATESMKRTVELQAPSHVQNETKEIWRTVLNASRVGFNDVYKKLGIYVKEQGESFYVDMLEGITQELLEKGVLRYSDGAVAAFIEGYETPLLVKTRDGTYLYAATDLATLKYRLHTLGMKRILYITDSSQRIHFEQLFKAGKLAGWYDPNEVSLEHITFGLVTGENGLKLSSRDGTPLTLAGLLKEAVVATKAAVMTSNSLERSERKDQILVPKPDSYQQYTDEG